RRARSERQWTGWRASARNGMHAWQPCDSTSPPDPPGVEPALGAGNDAVELVEQVARLRDRVGVPRDVAPQGAVDAGVVAERMQCLHARAVDAVEVPTGMVIPERHRRADMPIGTSRNGALRGKLRAAEPRLGPRRQG